MNFKDWRRLAIQVVPPVHPIVVDKRPVWAELKTLGGFDVKWSFKDG